jgi:hypothetical protein
VIIRKSFIASSLAVFFLFGLPNFISQSSAETSKIPRISIEEAKELLGNPNVIVIDVRTTKNWWRSAAKIVSAVREEAGSVAQWTAKYTKDQTLIFYCS